MKSIFKNYINTFKGLSTEIWWLALISLVNRAGTMVIPFLSKYLKEDLNFSYEDVGWIMACFGIGSVLGSYIGGRLTDKIGFYKIMVCSLFLTGFMFIGLQFVTSFWGLCVAIIMVMTIADSFRPALFVSLNTYSKKENHTRSLALIRLAINLGMAIGPTLAGFIIWQKGYKLLFWIDGVTCIIAIILFYCLVKEQPFKKDKNHDNVSINEAFKDTTYWVFIAVCFMMGMMFFQLFTTLPLYHKSQFDLNEFQTGLIMFVNVAVIVVFEMPFINFIEQKKLKATKLILYACVLFTVSFLVLYNNYWIGILIVSILIITVGEMIGFPYTNAFAVQRAKKGAEGNYMALYTIAFAVAHIFSPKIGLNVVSSYGYNANWLLTAAYGVIAIILSIWLEKRVKSNK